MKFKLGWLLALILCFAAVRPVSAATLPWWQFQAIDTMKYSRDPSRQYLSDPVALSQVTDTQVKAIAATGATHVAIATPYDDEFLPVLTAWVNAARRYNLKVWFRGNWSGWEGWFGYANITRDQHEQKTVQFIKTHPDLFQDGDVFSACPECENGGPGDPRQNGDVAGHRAFLISEYQAMSDAFRGIDRNVQVNFNSMNGDVARLVMDKATTQALGGIVVIDHYVATPEKFNSDINEIADSSGGQIVIGEFGAPIPDIHGDMTEAQQATWLQNSLSLLAQNPHVYGMSYWTSFGGSTAIWRDNGQPKPAVDVLTNAYMPKVITGNVTAPDGQKITTGQVTAGSQIATITNGEFDLAYINQDTALTITAPGYQSQTLTVSQIAQQPIIQLASGHYSFWQTLVNWVKRLIHQS